jgi:predicted ABC-type ATPase
MTMKKPTLIIIAGPNGSGKTSITHKVLQHQWLDNCVYINPDDIAKDTFGDWNAPEAVMQAAVLSTQMREDCIAEGKSLIFETVFSAPDKVDFVKRAKDKGYFIRLFFVSTESPTINASRIARRVMNGGHDVPISKIISRYSKSIANCCIVSKIVDRAYIYDNSVEYAEPTLLFRVINGASIKEYPTSIQWGQSMLDFIKTNK